MQLIYTNLGIFVLLVSSFIDITLSEPRVVCYYTNWSVYRPGTAKFNPQNINPYLCTHLIYAFGGFTKDNQLKTFDKYQDIEQGGYAKFTGLKTYNKNLKTMLAIGGWNEGSTRFSPLVASADRRAQLVKNSIKFLRQNKFDGLDLDWEYPAFRDGGKPKDRENYAKLVQELREEFDREHQKTGRPRLLLTMAVPAGFEYIDKGYDVPKLNKYLDWFNLLSYDYHSAYEPSVNHHAPLYPIEEENEYSFDNDLNINATINYYLKNGAERDKLVLGIPTYGRSYTLFNPDSYEIGAPADGPGEQGDATREKGYLAYYEICQSLKEEDSEWTVVQPNPEALGPYAYKDNQWVGYDDEDIVRRKSEFVVEQKLGGIMFWSIDNDDFRGLCNGKPYPLIEAAKESYLDGLENGVQRKAQYDKRKQTTTTRKPDAKKSAFGKTTTPPPPTTPSSGSDFKCEEEGFFPHPSDCTKYFWCLEAPGLGVVAHHFSCPSGLVFNKAADSCDYARNVYCTNKTPKSTTSTTTEATTTLKATTTERVVYNKVSSIYKNPSRTTQRTTTTAAPAIEIDSSDLEQEDPKVIKELIELIKKAGGIEELEKQINIQEETSSGKSDPKATTPSTSSTINKSLVDKIRNRASLFKTRPPTFNGASQAERTTEQKIPEQKSQTEKTKIVSSEEKQQFPTKKYNAINRFSRPEPQTAGIDKIPESDAVLIEKPQYTSILRRKPVKPDVIVENDYNNDSDKASEEESKSSSDSEVTRKYTSISRTRKPQEKIPEEVKEEEEDESDEDTTIRTTSSTARSTVNKYVNLSRRRQTTPEPEEKVEVTEEPATQGTRATIPSRRRGTTTDAQTTSKTVLEISTNNESKTLSRNTFENTLSKNTATKIERETLISNKHIHEEDDINHIALPTESVTEIISLPESATTTQILNTLSPQINANDDKVNDSFNDVIDGITESSDIDITTVSSEDIVDSNDNNNNSENNIGLSEQKLGISNIGFNRFSSPRPFTRPKLFQATTTITTFTSSSPLPTRKLFSRINNEINQETSRTTRRRLTTTRTFTTTEAPDDSPPSPRPTYTYRPGYRGTARFRASTTRSGEYDHDALSGSYKFVDDNRLRSLNIDRISADRANKRPSTVSTTTEQAFTAERSTRRRPSITRTQPTTTTTTPEIEVTTEQRILDIASGRFSLDNNERPDRLKFSLSTGGKITFGTNKLKSQEKSADADSKSKIITGRLDKSPISYSGRELKKGHVEEIPIQTSPETVTVQNFSDKLEISEIPISESEIKSFVSDDELRTDAPELDETTTAYRKRLRPSLIGKKKRPEESEESTTLETVADQVDSTTEKSLQRTRFTLAREQSQQRSQTKIQISDDDDSSQKSSGNSILQRNKSRANRLGSGFVRKSQLNIESDENVEVSSPRAFQNRFSTRTRAQKSNDEDVKVSTDSTTAKYLTKINARLFSRNRLLNNINNNNKVEDSENSETQDAPEESTLRTFLNSFRRNNPLLDDQESTTVDLDVLDLITEKSLADDQENEIDFTTPEDDENEITENPIQETTVRTIPKRVQVRKRPKKIESLAPRQTITEPANDIGITPEIDTTSSTTLTKEDLEDIETRIEIANDKETEIDTTSARPTRRQLITRKRIITSTTEDSVQEEKPSGFETSTTPKTTRKRILTIRTKTGAIQSAIEVGNFETTEPSTEASVDETLRNENGETDLARKRIRVYRPRTTTERLSEESSTVRSIVARTRVFKRPVATTQEEGSENTDEGASTIGRTRSRGRRPIASRGESADTAQENESETSSSGRKRLRQRVIKRPVKTEEETFEESERSKGAEEESSTSERTRFTPRIIKRPITAVKEETSDVTEETEGDVSTSERIRFTQRTNKRPTTVKEEQIEESDGLEEDSSTSERTRFIPKIIKRPIATTTTKEETSDVAEETEGEISTSERIKFVPRIIKRPISTGREETSEVSEGNEGEVSTSERARLPQRFGKRPTATREELPEESVGVEGEVSTSERTRFSPRRKIIKTSRRPVTSEPTEEEQVPVDEIIVESSTVGQRKAGFTRKILKAKTPKVLIDESLGEDSLVINTDEENQDIEQVEEKREEFENEENIEIQNQEISSDEPSSPNIKYPTRPAGRITVTTRKRPVFAQGRTTTVHPASTRFTKDGSSNVGSTRVRKITTRRFRPGQSNQESAAVAEIDQEKRIALGEKNKKIYKTYRKSTSKTTTISPNITPHNIDIETETNEYDEGIDTTDNPQLTNNNDILQTVRPRFPLSRFTTSTTAKPTTLHHVFAIDILEEDMNKLKNAELPENQADEVIKKLQKLIEINRIVEVYSKEEKLKLLKNKKLKSIKAGELTLEKPPSMDKFGEITRQVIIKLSVKPNITATVNATTEQPDDSRSPKNIMFSETVFGHAETSTISLEGLFEREKKELELKKEEISTEQKIEETLEVEGASHSRLPLPLLRPESNETDPLVINIANLEQVILKKIEQKIDDNETKTETTESPEGDETTTLVNDD